MPNRRTRVDHVLQLAAIDDDVEHAVLEQELAALEPLGQRLADGLLDDARAGEADQRLRLGDVQVAEHREAGRHAAGRRVGQQRDVGQPRAVEPRERALIFAICISDSAPSIIRAPPEQDTMTTGSCRAIARSMPRVIFSPTTTPMLPPMKPYSIAATTVSMPLIRPVAVMTASFRPVAAMLASSRLR